MKEIKQPIGQSPRNSEAMIENLSLKICHLQLSRDSRTSQLPMTNSQWPILNCIFLFSLLLALPLLSACQTNSSAPSQPSQPKSSPAAPAAPAPGEEANIRYNWSMPVEQMLDQIYAPLVGRTWLREVPPQGQVNPIPPLRRGEGGLREVPPPPREVNPGVLITLRPEHLMTKSEAKRAIEDELAKKGLIIVPIGEKYFKVLFKGAEDFQ